MRRVVVVLVLASLAGCFSKPGLRDRDGGGDDDDGGNGDGGGGDGGGGDGGVADAPIIGGCQNWGPWTSPVGVFANGPERFGPWLSPDGLVLVFQMGTLVYQIGRTTAGATVGSAMQIYTAPSNNDLQPFLSDDLMHLWIDDNSGGLLEASRTSTTAVFTNASPLPGPIDAIAETVEDVAVSGDGLRMIVTSGPSAQNEELYMSSRSTTAANFGALSSLPINTTLRNDCCAAITPHSFLWTKETATGNYEIWEAGWDGDGHFAGVGAPLPLTTGDVWHSPAISRDGTQLVVVRGAPGGRELSQMSRVCMDP